MSDIIIRNRTLPIVPVRQGTIMGDLVSWRKSRMIYKSIKSASADKYKRFETIRLEIQEPSMLRTICREIDLTNSYILLSSISNLILTYHSEKVWFHKIQAKLYIHKNMISTT